MAKLLIIDDDRSIRETLHSYFSGKGYSVESADDGLKGLEMVDSFNPDVILSDIRMPKLTGLELLEKLKEDGKNIIVILMTAFDDMQTTVQAIQKGAYDYLEKPIEISKLEILIKRAFEKKELSQKLETVVAAESESFDLKNVMIGKTKMMKDVYKKIGQVANNKVTVLIQGESGTGKELVARAIHYSGLTKNEPFIPINCTALSESLLESELFGHVKGAFTGSIKDKKGKFELAGSGTIFLDEISEISPSLQVKLLRVLQEKEFEHVGGERSIPIDARIIAATNKDLQTLVKKGEFREDLFFRLSVFQIELPPLKDRKEDIPLLVEFLLSKINAELHKSVTKIPDETMEKIMKYSWPGNVRELENTLMQAVVLSNSDVLSPDDILLRENHTEIHQKIFETNLSLAEVEKIHIQRVLDANNWDKPTAAKILGISLPTLYSKIENYGLKK